LKIAAKAHEYVRLANGNIRLTFETYGLFADEHQIKYSEWLEDEKKLTLDIRPYRQQRSLNANAYMWVLLDKLAGVLHTSKDELYLLMLERYGEFTHLIVKPEAVSRVRNEWRTSRIVGDVTVNGKPGVQIECYYGSSTYNTAEMAKLIDGVVSECREVGIETLPPDEVEALKALWEGNNANS
jgi:hypothetical protein